MCLMRTMGKLSDEVQSTQESLLRVAKAAYHPIDKFLYPRKYDYKWMPQAELPEVSGEEKIKACATSYVDGLRACFRLNVLFLAICFLVGIKMPTPMLASLTQMLCFSIWTYKITSNWTQSAMVWMKSSITTLIGVSGIALFVIFSFNYLDILNFPWYDNSVMVLSLMFLWISQLVIVEKMTGFLKTKAPVVG